MSLNISAILLYPCSKAKSKAVLSSLFFIDLSTKTQTVTLLMTIRSDSEFRRAKPKGKLGSFVGLKLLYRGVKKK